MHQIHVELGKNSYIIHIDKEILPKFANIAKTYINQSKVAIVTNNVVNELHGNILKESLISSGIETIVVEIPDGEEYKSFSGAMMIYDALVEHQMNRQSIIIALGGGVIGDLAGFVSATYMRGVPFIQIPTTLLAQVDSSVGGKTAINHPKAKNMIGAFYQPKFVFVDVNVLKTLPERELKAGIVEIIKHGMIMDIGLFGYMEDNITKILNLDLQSLEQIVSRSCKDKATIVEQDEKESNIRAILNYGHTIGHGIEAVTNYGLYRHGEAVSIGMVVAAKIAVSLGILDIDVAERQNQLLAKYGLPIKFPDLDVDNVINAIHLDKKAKNNGKSRFILTKNVGEAIIFENVTDEQIRTAIMEIKD